MVSAAKGLERSLESSAEAADRISIRFFAWDAFRLSSLTTSRCILFSGAAWLVRVI